MNFEYPYLLVLLLPAAGLWWLHGRRNRSAYEKRRYPLVMAGAFFLIVATANPYWSTVPSQRIVRGVDLIVVLDVSQSMFCQNYGEPRRIDQARNFLRTLLPEFPGSPVSLVYFSGDAQIGCPFTTDLPSLYLFLDSITPGMTAVPGTRSAPIEKVLAELLKERARAYASSTTRPLILFFGDGEFFDDSRSLQNWMRRRPEVRLFAFPCGRGQNAVPKYDLSAPFEGAFSQTHPDSLRSLAQAAGGISLPLARANTKEIAAQVLKQVNEFVAEGESIPKYESGIFLLLGLLCLLIHQLFPLGYNFIRPAAGLVSIILFLTASISMKHSESYPQLFKDALKDIRLKQYKEALQKLQKLNREEPSEEVWNAMGNTYFHQENYAEAIRCYREALKKNNHSRIARWNWEVALKRQATSNQPPPPTPPPVNPPPDQQPLPDQTQALLNSIDQMEKQQMQEEKKTNDADFQW